MNEHTNQLWELLQQNGIVQGELPDGKAPSSPWYIKALLAFFGWLAALFILAFIGTAFEFVFRRSGIAGIVGVFMLAGAFSLLRFSVNEFVQHLGLATSMAGQVLIAYALFDLSGMPEIVAWLLISVLQAGLVVLMPNFVHRVFSALVASIAIAMTLHEIGMTDVAGGVLLFGASFCWLNEFRYPQQMAKIRAIGYGLTLGLIVLKGTSLFGYRAFGDQFLHNNGLLVQPWLGEVIIGVVTLYVVWRIVRQYGQLITSRLATIVLLATIIVGAVSINAQGITVGMVIVCFGFFRANRVLLGLGIVSLLFYISSYYYLLDTTLLGKSQSLLAVGLILLLVRWLLQRIIPEDNGR